MEASLKDFIWSTGADNAKKQAVVGPHLVRGEAFPSPFAAEMAEINQIQYKMEYTKRLSEQTRFVEKLKVMPPNADLEQWFQEGVSNASVMLQVPESIKNHCSRD